MAFLLTAGEALVHVAGHERWVNLQLLHGRFHVLSPGAQVRGFPVHRSLGRTQEVGHGDTGNFHRVLHRQEQAGAGTLIHTHLGDVFTIKQNLAGVDLILRVPRDGGGQCRFARAVGTHNGVNLAGFNGQVHALEDGLSVFVVQDDRDVQVLDFKGRHYFS